MAQIVHGRVPRGESCGSCPHAPLSATTMAGNQSIAAAACGRQVTRCTLNGVAAMAIIAVVTLNLTLTFEPISSSRQFGNNGAYLPGVAHARRCVAGHAEHRRRRRPTVRGRQQISPDAAAAAQAHTLTLVDVAIIDGLRRCQPQSSLPVWPSTLSTWLSVENRS